MTSIENCQGDITDSYGDTCEWEVTFEVAPDANLEKGGDGKGLGFHFKEGVEANWLNNLRYDKTTRPSAHLQSSLPTTETTTVRNFAGKIA